MRRQAALAVTLTTLMLAALVPGRASGQSISREGGEVVPVAVTNFPNLLKVEGEVAVKGPILQTSLTTLEDILVPPVRRSDSTHLVDAGTVTTDGFAAVVVTLLGEVKGQLGRAGTVGAVLLLDDGRVQRALDERGQFLMPEEAKAENVGPGTAYFASRPARFTVAFPRYRVLLYNETDRTVSVTVHAYKTN